MEKLFSLEYGVGGICVLLTLMVIVKVGEFVWQLREKKDSLSDAAIKDLIRAVQDLTMSIQLLEMRFSAVEASVSEFPKIKKDLSRFYSAIKEIAGERWPDIRDEILKDAFTT